MLQSIREGVGRWIAIAILGLIAITFIFWGVDFTTMGTTFAARVNGTEIPLLEFERDLQFQQSQWQELNRVELTDDLRTELREAVLERMILDEALTQQVQDAGYYVSDGQLTVSIRERPDFQIGGEFSLDVFRASLLNVGVSEQMFLEMERERLEQLELQSGIMTSGFYTTEEYLRYVELYDQQREVAYAIFAAEDFLEDTGVTDEQIATHFEVNSAAYFSDESVDIEYLEVQGADIAESVNVTEEELLAYFEDEQFRFQSEEERQASHILLNLDTEDPEAIAAEIIARVEAGEDFGDLAAEFSEDAGTSGLGGDLGWVTTGGFLAGPFEDALFAMELGQVDGPVETDFGYHIIQFGDLREGQSQTFEEVREELALDFQSNRAEELFYNLASELANLSFDAYDELDSVAGSMEIPLQTLSGLTRTGETSPFEDPALIAQAAFSPAVLGQGENSTPIELTDNHVVVLRVTEHNQSAEQELEAVRDEIEAELQLAAAQDLAETAANDFLAAVVVAEDANALAETNNGSWNQEAWIGRTDAAVPTQLLAAAFRSLKPAEGDVLREVVALASGDYAVLVLSGVEPGTVDSIPRDERNLQNEQLSQQASLAELTGYALEVREDATVRIPDLVLNPIGAF